MFRLRSDRRAQRERNALAAQVGLRAEDLSLPSSAVLASLLDENAQLRARLAQAELEADRDPLTKLLNRRAFLRALHKALSFVERYQTPAAVVYLDLDGFKAINDGFGHAAGDAVLRHIARLLRQNVRDSDIVGRLGGDEFGLILAHASLGEAHQKADRLAAMIRSQPCVYAGVSHRVCASIGVRALDMQDDPETALARADEAMYAEKHARRQAAKAG